MPPITVTPQQSQYWAYALTVAGSSGTVEGLSRSIANARVDLNPHQVDAALFALRSPLSRGVILADEVGLGKTIEAGIVIAQRWAEKKRKILLIVPAMLRKQWQQELLAKFFLPCTILDGATIRKMDNPVANPFDSSNEIIICSYHFAAANKDRIRSVPWDIVVIDEAHRLRNVYKTGSKTARDVAAGVQSAFKLLLTATPLQNTLNELYGLVSVIDEHVFGDIESFRDQFSNGRLDPDRGNRLRDRIAPICIRTLRKQVVEYIPFSATDYWQHGHSTENDFIFVTTQTLSYEQLTKISADVGPDRSLLICCSAFRGVKAGDFPNLTVKKIPKAVLATCEWGHDDYSLEIQNLPMKAPAESNAGILPAPETDGTPAPRNGTVRPRTKAQRRKQAANNDASLFDLAGEDK